VKATVYQEKVLSGLCFTDHNADLHNALEDFLLIINEIKKPESKNLLLSTTANHLTNFLHDMVPKLENH